MIRLKNRIANKKGATVVALVIVLMLIFPFIISGLIDFTNCSVIKKTLKQELNSATKAAANSLDMKSAKNGVYRIQDGVLNVGAYGSKALTGDMLVHNEYYKNSYNNAGNIFFTLLGYNNLIREDAWDNVVIDTETYTNGYNNNESTSSAPIFKYTMIGDKSSAKLKRTTKVFYTIVNNSYNYNKEIDKYIKANPTAIINTISIPLNDKTGLQDVTNKTWANWNPATNEENNIDVKVDSYRPTVVGVAIVEYEPSPIFRFFGDKYKKIYIKEYATSELIISNNYWTQELTVY